MDQLRDLPEAAKLIDLVPEHFKRKLQLVDILVQ